MDTYIFAKGSYNNTDWWQIIIDIKPVGSCGICHYYCASKYTLFGVDYIEAGCWTLEADKSTELITRYFPHRYINPMNPNLMHRKQSLYIYVPRNTRNYIGIIRYRTNNERRIYRRDVIQTDGIVNALYFNRKVNFAAIRFSLKR